MFVTYLDTHVVAFLHHLSTGKLSRLAQELVDNGGLRISPIVVLELSLLHEIGRIGVAPAKILQDLGATHGLEVCQTPFTDVVGSAATLTWTRNPFDRLIAGQAAANRAALITKDQTILRHYPRAVW